MSMRMAITVLCDRCEEEVDTIDDIEVTEGEVIGGFEAETDGMNLDHSTGEWLCDDCTEGDDE